MVIYLDITLCRLGKSPESECRYMSYPPVSFRDSVSWLGEDFWVCVYKLRRVEFVGGFLLLWEGSSL